MSDEQKNVELPQETQPVTTADVPAEIKPLEVVPVTEAPVVVADAEAAPAAAAAATEATEAEAAPAAAEDKKEEEVKPVEEGHLEHKGQPANFPKNLLFSKKFFWFGNEAVDLKSISSFKADKAADVAHHVTAWAAETGKGLLFFSEKSDKAAPHGAIHLADASEPATDGPTKFHFTAKGHKHAFKASNTAERDNWVSQLKVKIAEAKELAATVVESETYKKTIETLKPAAVKKEEKAPEAAAATEPATEAAAETPATEETPAATEEVAATEPVAKEEAKEEGSKRRSASRKRTSIFGNLGFGKKEEKKPVTVEAVPEPQEGETEAPAAEAATEAPATEEAAATTEPAVTETSAAPVEEAAAPAEEKKEEAAETPVRPTPAKRTSLFGNLSFGKKKAASPAPVATEEAPAATTEPVAETAPVIPAVDTTEPLSTEVNSPATVPTETVEVPAATNGESSPKKEVKSDKRKSSLPFAFGKKEKATSDEEIEKPKSPSPFSRLRDTIKGKGKGKAEKTEKVEEKTEEVPAIPETEVEAEAAKEEAAPATTEEVAKPATETEATPAAPATEETEAEKPAASVPVTAAA
ncbi:pleckstrin domain-containing protein [Neurospora hispaniola]|uniref:Pleckstrin homology domain-containing protein n=1 Tax=Neurospora hispaniola TaxID=588809 RepID=A0AAJ0ICU2_9PEZI|nr:Pleckstrin homology domain-containing protein [Neurospora hispaniola]